MKLHDDCNFSKCHCYDCPYRYCRHEHDMYEKLVNQTKFWLKRGIHWISIDFEENDAVALKAFERYKTWLGRQGFEGDNLSYKTWIRYCDDGTPVIECGYHSGTFYFHYKMTEPSVEQINWSNVNTTIDKIKESRKIIGGKEEQKMSRVEDNEKVLEDVVRITNNKSSGTYEEVVTLQLSLIGFMLGDISKSLAIIADKLEKEE